MELIPPPPFGLFHFVCHFFYVSPYTNANTYISHSLPLAKIMIKIYNNYYQNQAILKLKKQQKLSIDLKKIPKNRRILMEREIDTKRVLNLIEAKE